MLLMVGINRRNGLTALLGAWDGLQEAIFHAKDRHQQPNTTQLDPTPAFEALTVARELSS